MDDALAKMVAGVIADLSGLQGRDRTNCRTKWIGRCKGVGTCVAASELIQRLEVLFGVGVPVGVLPLVEAKVAEEKKGLQQSIERAAHARAQLAQPPLLVGSARIPSAVPSATVPSATASSQPFLPLPLPPQPLPPQLLPPKPLSPQPLSFVSPFEPPPLDSPLSHSPSPLAPPRASQSPLAPLPRAPPPAPVVVVPPPSPATPPASTPSAATAIVALPERDWQHAWLDFLYSEIYAPPPARFGVGDRVMTVQRSKENKSGLQWFHGKIIEDSYPSYIIEFCDGEVSALNTSDPTEVNSCWVATGWLTG